MAAAEMEAQASMMMEAMVAKARVEDEGEGGEWDATAKNNRPYINIAIRGAIW